ncbi:MAG: DUF3048 domain-containing protein [Clostridia bacterium]|nr:DUF3048 domain-containing protein [Clostridia bacterium]
MKLNIKTILLLLCITMLTGCGKSGPAQPVSSVEISNQQTEVDLKAAEIESFFKKHIDTKERPIAVMIDNDDKNARPHAGLSDAHLIYEMVVEGGATRFMAIYRGTDTEKIGPVRSSRHYFLDYVMENDAIYTHYGWSPKAITDISAFGINKINGVLGGDGDIFWREQKFKGDWHSAYTSIKNIKDMASKKGYSLETGHQNGLKYAKDYRVLPKENSATKINLAYSQLYNTGYTYSEKSGLYEKNINGAPHTLQNGETLAVKNIIIELKYDTALGDGTARRNINTTGSGKGYYITGGCFEEITWSKTSRRGNTTYKKADGTELLLSPGKTIVNIISPSAEIVIE